MNFNATNFYTRNTCRLCNSKNVPLIYKFPSCPPVDNYRFSNEKEISYPNFPMDLYQCSDCGHAQLLDVVNPKILFGNYIYTSTSSPDLSRHFEIYAEKLMQYAGIKKNDLIIDVGSNDGLFLSKLKNHEFKVLGVDASQYAAEIAFKDNAIDTIIGYFDLKIVKKILLKYGQAKVVTANNVFSHSDDLKGFATAVKELLLPEGLFVFEVSYLRDLVEKRVVDYVYHEHLAHHSIKPLKAFFQSIGMKLVDVERVNTKGGSIRCFVSKENSSWKINPSVEILIGEEISFGLYLKETYIELEKQINFLKNQILVEFEFIRKQGGTIASYGASATSTVLNYLLDVNNYFSFIIDDNPYRHGRLSPEVLLPVKSRDSLLVEKPTAVFISAWRFAEMIVESNSDYLKQGGIFIVPLPNLKIIKN